MTRTRTKSYDAASQRWTVRDAGGRVLQTCKTEAAADRVIAVAAEQFAAADAERAAGCHRDYAVRLDQGDWLELRGGYDWGRTTEGRATLMTLADARRHTTDESRIVRVY